MGIDDRGRPRVSTPSTQPSALVSGGREFDPEAGTQNWDNRLGMAKQHDNTIISFFDRMMSSFQFEALIWDYRHRLE